MKKLYQPLINKAAKFFTTSRRSSELIKYASNAFLATKITYINELANLCEKLGINVEDIALGMGSDVRIGSRFLRAGPAYGGSCFPKDTKGLISTAKKFNTEFNETPNHLSLLSYDLIGLVYYLSLKNNLADKEKIFKKENSFKGKIGIFDIENNKINHRLNFYEISNGELKEIF